jgi:cellobiose-specific phosphotransferase system component IIC
MFRFIFQFGVSSGVFLFSSLVAWYEGSALLEHPSEWRSSTPFTQLLHGPGPVHSFSHISQWDFFVYAAKYEPTFPMMMTVSGLYLLIFLGYYIFKKARKWYAYYLFLISCSLFLLGYFCFESSTDGTQKMFVLFSGSGLVCMLIGFIFYLMASIRMKRMTTD